MELADIRLKNALVLRDHFAREWERDGDARARSVEGSFADLIGIKPAHWSQIKAGRRHIGEKVARQIEQACGAAAESLDKAEGAALPRQMLRPQRIECESEEERQALELFQLAYRMNAESAKRRLVDVLHAELLKQDEARAGSASQLSVIGKAANAIDKLLKRL